MHSRILAVMDQIAAFLKRFSLKQVFIVLLASFLLMTSTACSPPTSRAVGEGSYKERVGQNPDIYDTVQKPVGGMNQFNDTPANLDRSKADAKAKELIDNSRRNLSKRATSPGDLVENAKAAIPVDKQAKDFTENVGDRLEQFGENATEGTRRGMENLKENVKDAGRSLQKAVKGDPVSPEVSGAGGAYRAVHDQ